MSRFAAFRDTFNMFLEFTHYTRPLSYEEWKEFPEDRKAALLFVQFYNEITLAWDKADSLDWGDDAEGVTTVLQYLQRNISHIVYYMKSNPSKKANAEYRRQHPEDVLAIEQRIIDQNPEKFSSRYIYRVAYNCLYCIAGHDRQCDKDRINNETSPIVTYEGKELNLFDTIADRRGSIVDQYEYSEFEKEFWDIIEAEGIHAVKVMRYLLSHDVASLKKITASNKLYSVDPLRDVEVSIDKVDAILASLRERFLSMPSNSECGRLLSEFSALFA